MQFPWVILIALWTLIAGPVFDRPPRAAAQAPRGLAETRGAIASAFPKQLPH